MAEKDIDKLLSLTDSKYRLSVVTAKRALQLRSGAPSVLPVEQRVRTHNLVTQAMRELATEQLTVGTNLIDEQRFHQDYVRSVRPSCRRSSTPSASANATEQQQKSGVAGQPTRRFFIVFYSRTG
jgi:DNA-directed RNA polymerase subunit omega (EC 2.7.7.6)